MIDIMCHYWLFFTVKEQHREEFSIKDKINISVIKENVNMRMYVYLMPKFVLFLLCCSTT